MGVLIPIDTSIIFQLAEIMRAPSVANCLTCLLNAFIHRLRIFDFYNSGDLIVLRGNISIEFNITSKSGGLFLPIAVLMLGSSRFRQVRIWGLVEALDSVTLDREITYKFALFTLNQG